MLPAEDERDPPPPLPPASLVVDDVDIIAVLATSVINIDNV